MKKYESKRRGLVVSIIILIVLVLGVISYICYDKFHDDFADLSFKQGNSSSDALIIGNSFFLGNEVCVEEGDTCIKMIKVSYDGENHVVKIKLLKDNKSSVSSKDSNLKYEIYIDGKFVDSFEGGTIKTSMIVNFNANVYVINNKYISILTERQSSIKESDYVMTFYSNESRMDESVLIKIGGQGLSLSSDHQSIVNNLDDLIFDGNSFVFWAEKCNSSKKMGIKYKLIFDGNYVRRTILETVSPIYVIGTSC